MLRTRWNNVEINLYQRCFNGGHQRSVNVVQRWKSDVGFCFIFNVGSTLFQRWSTTLKQRWSNVEMLAGIITFACITNISPFGYFYSFFFVYKHCERFHVQLSRQFNFLKIWDFFIVIAYVSLRSHWQQFRHLHVTAISFCIILFIRFWYGQRLLVQWQYNHSVIWNWCFWVG